ncbi:SIMPL domain-containing protein [Capillimicrobium parvum]|uniref:26 kDa periplasmic immunogenic protein n=1 Tax=Capillimicrobium parvum TaxID=2884022 RepID=A0A9E7C0I6_9ACTN|nr:SIMPL domain-containing protein [Capillimicrobium parvum]UGS35443.1 26 kDa periplasmic immunogenic protein [Capillimicrobium parvum]
MHRLLLIAVALLALAVPGVAAAADATTPTLAVLGQGTAFATPDTANVEAAVARTATSREAARDDVARRTTALLAALQRLGVPRADIQTQSIAITRSTHKRRPRVRYTARAALSAHLTNVALVGPVFDALTAARADDVTGPSFGFSNPTAGLPEAEQAALADARARADAAAAAVGMRVIGVQSINLDPSSVVTPGVASDSASAGAAAPKQPTPVETGRVEVSAAVAVVFLLGPA